MPGSAFLDNRRQFEDEVQIALTGLLDSVVPLVRKPQYEQAYRQIITAMERYAKHLT